MVLDESVDPNAHTKDTLDELESTASKRVRLSPVLDNTSTSVSGKHMCEHGSDNLFLSLCGMCGLKIAPASRNNNQLAEEIYAECSTNSVMFAVDMAKRLKTHPTYPAVIDTFIDHMQEYVSSETDIHAFTRLLSPVTMVKGGWSSGFSHTQETVMRMLLGVEDLQSPVMDFLLEKLPELAMDDRSDSSSGKDMPRFVLSQLRWLDCIFNGKGLATKMFEMISITPLDTQKEIIDCIPDIVSDSEHGYVVEELNNLLLNNRELTIPVLDALSNLNLTSDISGSVRDHVLMLLPSIELDDLPMAVRYILQDVMPSSATKIVLSLRANLEFSRGYSMNISQNGSSSIPSGENNHKVELASRRSAETLTLDAIKTGARFQKTIGDAWLKAIQFLTEQSSVILFVCSDFLGSPDLSVQKFASHFYYKSFCHMDKQSQQQVISALVTHIGSMCTHEIDSAMDTLLAICTDFGSKAIVYAVYIKGILDYVDNLSLEQVRKLFLILAVLTFSPLTKDKMRPLQDEMHMILRKRLSCNVERYQRIGIAAATVIVGYIGAITNANAIESESESINSMDTTSIGSSGNREIDVALGLLKIMTQSITLPSCVAFYCDELASLVASGVKLVPDLVNFLNETVLDSFVSEFTIDIQLDGEVGAKMPMFDRTGQDNPCPFKDVSIDSLRSIGWQLCHNLDGTDAPLAVDILGLVLSRKPNKGESLTYMNSKFKLMALIEKQETNSMDAIDALEGCPVYWFCEENVTLHNLDSFLPTEQEHICSVLYHTLNWFREIINGFVSQKDPSLRSKLLTRLNATVEMESFLCLALVTCPNFRYLVVLPQAKGFKKKYEGVDDNSKTKEKRQSIESMMKRIKPNLRELDLEVFDMLSWDSANIPSNAVSWKPDSGCLMLPHLIFLISDLNDKLAHVLGKGYDQFFKGPLNVSSGGLFSKTKTSSAGASSSTGASSLDMNTAGRVHTNDPFRFLDRMSQTQILEFAVNNLPHICTHLETLIGTYQECQEHENNLDYDDNEITDSHNATPKIDLCRRALQLLLQNISCIVHCNLLQAACSENLKNEVLNTFAYRTNPAETQSQCAKTAREDPTALLAAFMYFENCAETLEAGAVQMILFKLMVFVTQCTPNSPELVGKLHAKALTMLKHENDDSCLSAAERVTAGLLSSTDSCDADEITLLTDTYVGCAVDEHDALTVIVGKFIPDLIEANTPTAWKLVATYQKSVAAKLLIALKNVDSKVSAELGTTEENILSSTGRKCSHLKRIIRLFRDSNAPFKTVDRRAIYNNMLKDGHALIEAFTRIAIPFFSDNFVALKDDVLEMLDDVQKTTRLFQVVCSHSKVTKDTTLTGRVPRIKKSMEILIYRVKAIMETHGCRNALYIGNLKHRDIQWQVVASQVPVQQSSDECNDSGSDAENEYDHDEVAAQVQKQKNKSKSTYTSNRESDDNGNTHERDWQQDKEYSGEEESVEAERTDGVVISDDENDSPYDNDRSDVCERRDSDED
eukprot:CFRG6799T1